MGYLRVDSQLSEAGVDFRYQDLNQQSNEIRLLRLHQAASRDVLNGTLETFKIDNCPSFRALSYVWGNDAAEHAIYVNDQVLEVRLNLLMFLWSYRKTMRAREDDAVEYIWIDHICIDQKNTSERNHQVQLMSRIFRRAYQVIAWLGPDYDQLLLLHQYWPGTVDFPPMKQSVPTFGPKFFRSKFWDRLWIQQEMVLASEVVFMVGTTFVPATQIRDCYGGSTWLITGQPALMEALNKDKEGFKYFPLLEAIRLFSAKDCTKPVDRVFGLLGMVYPHERIEVDYRMSKHELFCATVRAVLDSVDFPCEHFDEEAVTSTLVELGMNMGLYYDEALGMYRDM